MGNHPQHTCTNEDRLDAVETTLKEHTTQLGQGAQQFIRLEMGLANVAEKVGELIGVLKWAAFGLATFVFLLAGGALVWVIVQSGGKAVGVTP
jgi:hypothetical protein